MSTSGRIVRAAALTAAVLTSFMALPLTPSAAQIPERIPAPSAAQLPERIPGGGPYLLVNLNSGKCLEVGFAGTADLNTANQYDCHGGTNQQWFVDSLNRIVNVNSGKCLEIGFGGTADFNAANQYTCHGGTNQQWMGYRVDNYYLNRYRVFNVNSGKCLEIEFGGTANFNAANQYTCHSGTNQQWAFQF